MECCACKYYDGVRDVRGHAPCSFWGIGGVMWNDYCSRFESIQVGNSMPDAIRYARKKRHMTQQQLADAVGLHVMTIRRYESCNPMLRRIPPVKMCKKIADALEVPSSTILNAYYVSDNHDTDRSSR